jgi:MtrB/PioB family decaheme-associated outer membrane protein
VAPSLLAEDTFDLRVLREQARLDLDLTRGRAVDVRLSYSSEKRRGNRNSGTSFGFSNVVETAEPVEYRTQDVSLSAEWARSWGLLRGAVQMNWFDNAIEVQAFDNPFRAVDSTDPNAYQAPGSGSINGPRLGRIALPPDNRAVTGSVGGSFRFGRHTRVSADASLGQWTQDEAFIPFSTNTAITSPVNATDPAALPARSLDGRIRVSALSATVSSRPVPNLTLTGRFRRYDLDNETPRLSLPQGYARFDAAWNANGRISVPYGYGTDRLLASAAYTFGRLNLEAGYRREGWDRTFRDTEETAEDTFFAGTWVKPRDWAMLRATVERGRRTFDHYDFEHSEHASFLGDVAPTNLPSLRRFDQAERDRTRAVVLLQLTPWGESSFSFTYADAQDDYGESPHGLLEAGQRAFSADADWTPTDRLNLYGFYSRERIRSLQRGRQSGATPSANPADDWTSDIDTDADTVGFGGTFALVRDRLDLSARATWQRVDGFNDLESPPGGTPDFAVDIPAFDDTEIAWLSSELQYRVSARWRVGIGGWLEDYDVDDAQTVGLPNYVPGAFFLAPFDGDYTGGALFARLVVSW